MGILLEPHLVLLLDNTVIIILEDWTSNPDNPCRRIESPIMAPLFLIGVVWRCRNECFCVLIVVVYYHSHFPCACAQWNQKTSCRESFLFGRPQCSNPPFHFFPYRICTPGTFPHTAPSLSLVLSCPRYFPPRCELFHGIKFVRGERMANASWRGRQ